MATSVVQASAFEVQAGFISLYFGNDGNSLEHQSPEE